MNKIIKMSMLAALTMSSASVFAATGDAVTGGQGSVTIDGTVQTNTCAVSVDKQALNVKVLKADIDKALVGADIAATGELVSTFSLTNCSGQAMKVQITPTSGSAITTQPGLWSIPDVNILAFKLGSTPSAPVGAKWQSLATGLDWTAAVSFTGSQAGGMRLLPTADTATFPVTLQMGKSGAGTYSGPSTFSTGYTYNLTYL